MNNKISAKLLIVLSVFAFVIYSCKEDEGFHQISAVEQQIHQKINDHRLSNQLSSLVFQPLLFKEARTHSLKMANRKTLTDEGIEDVIDELINKIGGTEAGYIIDMNQYAIADSIVKQIILNTDTNELVLGNFTQAGVGVAADSSKINYITVLFLNIPD
jgi:uncharacterized protein YkwD